MPRPTLTLDTFENLFKSTDEIDMPDVMRQAVKLIQSKKIEELKSLIKTKRTLTIVTDQVKNTMFHYATYIGDPLVVKGLLELRAGISAKNQYDLQPIHIAAFFGKSEAVKLLDKSGAEHTTISISVEGYKIECSPLHLAILNGQIETTLMLLEIQSDQTQDIRVSSLGTIFHLLVLSKDPSMLRRLINHAWLTRVASSELYKERNNKGVTPLALAATVGNVDAINALVTIPGINIDDYSVIKKETALHVVARAENSNVQTIDALLKNGATINLRDEVGCTPLYRAVEASGDNFEIVAFLLKNLANPEIADEDGLTPLAVAQQKYNAGDKRYEKIIALLDKRQESSLSYSLGQTMMFPPKTDNFKSDNNDMDLNAGLR